MNQLSYVAFGLAASQQCGSLADELNFLTSIAEKVDTPTSQDAYVFAETEIARVKLRMQDKDGAGELLEKASKILDTFNSIDPVINAAYYAVNADYYWSKADFTSYYRNSLLYLACINLSEMPLLQQRQKAYNLAIGALLGDKIYNFGELLLHPILISLKGTDFTWICDLLFAINAGDVKSFEGLSGHIAKAPLLQNSLPFIKEKVSLMALIEAVFRRPTSSRVLSFETIGEETRLVTEAVELMVMKALSLGLMKGFIDQVSETVTITWLQPRVMSKAQIESMRNRLIQWNEEVKNLGTWMHDAGDGIWTSA